MALERTVLVSPQLATRSSRRAASVRAQAAATELKKSPVPLKLEEGEMPLNTYSNKAPFEGTIVSVKRIVGPKATGETCDIVIKTDVRGRSLDQSETSI